MKRELPTGCKAYFYHERKWLPDLGPLDPRGGKTLADVIDSNGDCIATGIAVCGKRDNFNKRIGRDIALGRALKSLEDETQAQDARRVPGGLGEGRRTDRLYPATRLSEQAQQA